MEKKQYVVRGCGTIYYTFTTSKQDAIDNWKMWYLGSISQCPDPSSVEIIPAGK